MDNVLVLNDHILPLPTTPFEEFRLSNQLQMSFRSVFLDHSSQGVQTRETRTFRNGYGLTVTSRQHNRFKIVRRGGKKKEITISETRTYPSGSTRNPRDRAS